MMTEEEMEYEGGFLNFIAAAVCTVASIGCSIIAEKTNNNALRVTSTALDVASIGLSLGATTCVSLASAGIKNVVIKTVAKKVTCNNTVTASEYKMFAKTWDSVFSTPMTGITMGLNSHN